MTTRATPSRWGPSCTRRRELPLCLLWQPQQPGAEERKQHHRTHLSVLGSPMTTRPLLARVIATFKRLCAQQQQAPRRLKLQRAAGSLNQRTDNQCAPVVAEEAHGGLRVAPHGAEHNHLLLAALRVATRDPPQSSHASHTMAQQWRQPSTPVLPPGSRPQTGSPAAPTPSDAQHSRRPAQSGRLLQAWCRRLCSCWARPPWLPPPAPASGGTAPARRQAGQQRARLIHHQIERQGSKHSGVLVRWAARKKERDRESGRGRMPVTTHLAVVRRDDAHVGGALRQAAPLPQPLQHRHHLHHRQERARVVKLLPRLCARLFTTTTKGAHFPPGQHAPGQPLRGCRRSSQRPPRPPRSPPRRSTAPPWSRRAASAGPAAPAAPPAPARARRVLTAACVAGHPRGKAACKLAGASDNSHLLLLCVAERAQLAAVHHGHKAHGHLGSTRAHNARAH